MKNELTNNSSYENEYIPFVIRFGRATNLLGVLLAFLPAPALTFVFDLHPPVSAVIAGFIMQASVSGVFWFVEPISYSPVLGMAGTYMSFLSGNIGNLRLPASVAALNNILPALFGAMLAQQFVPNPKIGSVAVALAGVMFALFKTGCLAWLPGTPSYAVVIVSVFGTILIGRKIMSSDLAKKS